MTTTPDHRKALYSQVDSLVSALEDPDHHISDMMVTVPWEHGNQKGTVLLTFVDHQDSDT